MALLKNQSGKGYGASIEISGIEELTKTLGQFPSLQNRAFKEAAKKIGVELVAKVKNNLRSATGRPKKIGVRELSAKAREQISNGTFSMREKLSKKESDDIYMADLKKREGEGKSGKPRKKYYQKRQVKISDHALPKKYSNSYFPLTGAIVDDAKTNVYGRTGNLLKSISSKIWSPKAKATRVKGHKWKRAASGIVVLMVGPTRIQGIAYNTWARAFQKTNTFNYAHLVDKGHNKVVFGKKTGGFVPGNNFISGIKDSMELAATVREIAREVLVRHINGPDFRKKTEARKSK